MKSPNIISAIISDKGYQKFLLANYLLSLAEPEEAQELSIQDFIPQTVSVFTKMFAHKDNLEVCVHLCICMTNCFFTLYVYIYFSLAIKK